MLETFFHTETALGSKTTLVIVADSGQSDFVNNKLAELWRTIFVFEKQFSRFLPNSELSQFNRSAGPKTQISPEFRDLLLAAKQISLSSEGLFNPFILPALQRAGYTKSMVKGYEDESHDDYSKLQVAAPDQLVIGDTWASIPYGSAIEMGGCGKGYLADQLSQMVQDQKIKGYWFSLGGDIAGGGLDATDKPWRVELQETDQDQSSSVFVQTTGKPFAVATSGTRVRGGNDHGNTWHHILDPRTLKPAKTDVFMASITGESALHADVYASCAIILGTKDAPKYLKKRPEIDGYLLQSFTESGAAGITKFGKTIKVKSANKELVHAQ